MDESATFGILSGWNARKPLSEEHWLEISDLLRSIGEYGGAGPQRKALIRLSETEEIFVYTPKGDIYYFPKGSTVLDFAYKIHSDLGDCCEGATVNGLSADVTHILKDGDIVEIRTSEEPLDADPDLEALCKTPKARTAINRRIHQHRLHYAEIVGKQLLLQELLKHGFSGDVLEGENIRLILEVVGVGSLNELLTRIGQDVVSPHVVLYYLSASAQEGPARPDRMSTPSGHCLSPNILFVSDLDKSVHKFARCCNPHPGREKVVATLSERGVTFHNENCMDLLQRHDLAPQKLLSVAWRRDVVWRHPLVFQLEVFKETPGSLFPFLSFIPKHVRILKVLECMDKANQPSTRFTVVLRDFNEALAFFDCLSSCAVVIEDYGRSGASADACPPP
jgi:GTP pyrophosphokinase